MNCSKGLAAVFFILSTVVPMFASDTQLYPNARKYKDAGSHPVTARSGSALLQVRTLVGKATTDVEVMAGQFDGTPAGTLEKVQIKFYGPKKELLLADNYRKDALNGSYAKFSYGPGYRGQSVQVQANVSGIDPARTDVLTADATVGFRPDLTVQNIQVAGRANVNEPVSIAAVVRELNLDFGARANCNLSVDGVRVDSATGIWVDAGDSVTCEFTHVFTSTGVKQLSVDVTDVNPADYDTENNSASAQIEIVDASVPVSYSMTAKDKVVANQTETRTHLDWQATGSGSYVKDTVALENSDTREVGYQSNLNFDHLVAFPVVLQTSGLSDGQTFFSATMTLNASFSFQGGTCGSLLQSGRVFRVCTYPSTSKTEVQITMRSGTVTYYSSTTVTTVDASGTSSVYTYNPPATSGFGVQPVPAIGNHVDIRASVTDAAATYDANASIDLYAVDVTTSDPETCTTWNITYSTGRSTGYQCKKFTSHTYGKEGSRIGVD